MQPGAIISTAARLMPVTRDAISGRRKRLTSKGEAVRDMLRELFGRHLGSLSPVGNVAADDLDQLNVTLKRLERFWIDQVRFRL